MDLFVIPQKDEPQRVGIVLEIPDFSEQFLGDAVGKINFINKKGLS
jgi:hypothetical protein